MSVYYLPHLNLKCIQPTPKQTTENSTFLIFKSVHFPWRGRDSTPLHLPWITIYIVFKMKKHIYVDLIEKIVVKELIGVYVLNSKQVYNT